MKYEIQWSNASVNNDQLSVPVSVDEPGTLPAWRGIFNAVAQTTIPGVSYSLADTWGHVVMDGHAVIRVDHVSDRVVRLLQGHLDAAVRVTTETYEQQVREHERREEAERQQAEHDAERDKELTDLFRQGGGSNPA